jgi:hypothetical protein
MENLGFTENTTNWFRDYLSDRKQCVDLEGITSDWEKVELGIPQGSIIGPVLFLIYINDVNNSEDTAIFTKFADDTMVLCSGHTIREAADNMNAAMKNIDRWFA